MSLALLPAELLHATFVHLAPEDLAAIATTSRALKAAAYDERLWATVVLGRPVWRICGAVVGVTSARLRYAQTRTRCSQCLQRAPIPVQHHTHTTLAEMRRAARVAMSLTRAQVLEIRTERCGSLTSRPRISVAVWPNRHGARVWTAELSRLDNNEAAEELRLLCSRDAVEGWTPLTGGSAMAQNLQPQPWRWHDRWGANQNRNRLEDFLVEAVKTSDLARYLPPLRAATFAARLQLECRAKEIALDRILLDGDCVFGFSIDGFVHPTDPCVEWNRVLVCQLSSRAQVLRFDFKRE